MTTALEDLQNRINSNTLTVAQQAAFNEALTAIVPTFPTIDEISRSNGQIDQPLSRAWMAVLYAVQSEGASGMVSPTRQIVWHINANTGNNANDGLTSGTAIKSAAYLASLWRGTVGGGRPLLNPATGTTITIVLDSAIPDTDPLSVLLDVDLVSGMNLVFEGSATAEHAGAMATASTYARTSAGGQQKITDGTIADYAPIVGNASLCIDTTTGGVGWLYGPFGSSSATGIVSRMYTAQSAGVLTTPTVIDPAGGDRYTLNNPTLATLGNGFITRQFPGDAAGTSFVIFFRVHFAATASAQSLLQSPTVGYFFQECQTDAEIQATNSQLCATINCFGFQASYIAAGGATVFENFAGAIQGDVSNSALCNSGAVLTADGDFVVCSDNGYQATNGGTLALGNCARFCNGAATGELFDLANGSVAEVIDLAQGSHVLYGVDGGSAFDCAEEDSAVTYGGTAVGSFDSTSTAFEVGKALTSAFSFKQADGTFVGPTTNTFAHLDAVQGAGTGFGGNLVEPASGCIVQVLT